MKKGYLLILVILFFIFSLKGVSGSCYDSGSMYTPNAYCYDSSGRHNNYCYNSNYVVDWYCDNYPYVRCNYYYQNCGEGYSCKNGYCQKNSYTPPPSTCYCYYNGINHECGPDSCGNTNGCGKCTYPEYCGSDYQCHSQCTSHASYKCYNNDVYWYNSCNQIEGKKQECGTAGCSGTKCNTNTCTSHYTYKCYNNDVYWYNSCNQREGKKQECGTLGCTNNKCNTCTSHYTYKCYNNDVYWYDSCNNRQDKKQECGTLGCSGSKCNTNTCTSHYIIKCYNNDVYWYNSCNQREGKKQECGTLGCSGSKCNTCTSHYTYKCYNNDVYWYDSCGNIQDKKQECGTLGCSNNKCNTCTSHYTYKCYNNDVYWYDSCNNRQEKKQECYSTGCFNNKCVTCSEACSGHSSKCDNYDHSKHNPSYTNDQCYYNWFTKGLTTDCSSKCWCYDKETCSSEECTSPTKGCVTPDCFNHCLNQGYNQGDCLTSTQENQCGGTSYCYYNFHKDTSMNFCTDNGKTGDCWCYNAETCNDCGNSKDCTDAGCCTLNGQTCSKNNDCCSNHCENGHCCNAGICCKNNNDCLLNEYCSSNNTCEKCPENSCGAKSVKNTKTCNLNQFGRYNNENHCSLICENEVDSKEACEICNSKFFMKPVFAPNILNLIDDQINMHLLNSDVKDKNACCLDSTDCVYKGVCIPLGSKMDVDLDLKEEICGN